MAISDRLIRPENLACYNGFYEKPECRMVVRYLYKGVCQCCGKEIVGNSFHVGHTIPQSHPYLMEEFFPGLDVNNLLNLHLACPRCNLKESNFVLRSPGILRHYFICAAGVISKRIAVALENASPSKKVLATMSAIDQRICASVVHIDVDEARALASEWNGGRRFSREDLIEILRARLPEALKIGGAVNDIIHYSIEEAIDLFKETIDAADSHISFHGSHKHEWWRYAFNMWRETIDNKAVLPPGERRPIRPNGLPAGIYLAPEEIVQNNGILFPVRTPAQRWFYDQYAVLHGLSEKLSSQSVSKRYLVLGEEDWEQVWRCTERLAFIEAGLCLRPRRFPKLQVITTFRVSDGTVELQDEKITLKSDVLALCRSMGSTSIWSDGAIISRPKIRAWLSQAIGLIELGSESVRDPELVRVESNGYWWVPSLPFTNGRTRKEVQAELPAYKGRRRKSRITDRTQTAA